MRCRDVLSQWQHGAYAMSVWCLLSQCCYEQPYSMSSRHVLPCSVHANSHAVPCWFVLHAGQQRTHCMRTAQLLSCRHTHIRRYTVSCQLHLQHHHRHTHSSACCCVVVVVIIFFVVVFFLNGRKQQ